jgi:hypothetical protein
MRAYSILKLLYIIKCALVVCFSTRSELAAAIATYSWMVRADRGRSAPTQAAYWNRSLSVICIVFKKPALPHFYCVNDIGARGMRLINEAL